jgi:hypothetical protein
MIKHQLDHYKDGFVSVAFCKVCAAEGEKLFDPCPQEVLAFKKYSQKYSDGPIKKT